ncbi:hypothetical protein M9H77_12681 [Catharanthus roseus]|uniref:Uncharacterized protein n=1 Tax=Catharanthus roseus TaxID=4058 RepID=A0ACC0BI55_CATRO|nr:hypothetical protein M9H77_12681 [Catharanthus roseus]
MRDAFAASSATACCSALLLLLAVPFPAAPRLRCADEAARCSSSLGVWTSGSSACSAGRGSLSTSAALLLTGAARAAGWSAAAVQVCFNMAKYFEKWKKSSKPEPVEESSSKKSRVGVEFSDCEIIGGPGLRKPINSYPYETRDELRRRYMAKGPTQPCDHKFPQTDFGHKHKYGDDMFTEVGFKNWKRAKEKFRNHEGLPNSAHSGAVVR